MAKMVVVLAHENHRARGGCEFSKFFQTTPQDLIDDGLYKALAFALYPGEEHRMVGKAQIANALGAVSRDSALFENLRPREMSIAALGEISSTALGAVSFEFSVLQSLKRISCTGQSSSPMGRPHVRPSSSSDPRVLGEINKRVSATRSIGVGSSVDVELQLPQL